jgi:predicted nucleic acid-binding protein
MKQALYLETSVIGAYLDNGEPFRRDLTIRWWEHEMPDYRTVISPLVTSELARVKEPHRTSYLKLIRDLEQVDLTEEAAILAEGYIARGIFHRKYIADALHVAIASFHKIDYLVTWNFGHLANVRRQARIKLFNTERRIKKQSTIDNRQSKINRCIVAQNFWKCCTRFGKRCRVRLITMLTCLRRWSDRVRVRCMVHNA